MSALTIWPDGSPSDVLVETQDPDEIAAQLHGVGVRFERWDSHGSPSLDASAEEVLTAYKKPIDRVVASNGYVLVDVVQIQPTDGPDWPARAAESRQRFLAEHTHDDDEDRFFVEGAGVFYLHLDQRVHAVLCTAGDLLSVPKGTTHWFDMGTSPRFVVVRFFHDTNGWVGNFTGSPIATQFPDFDALAGRFVSR